jgi:O-antigen/teichoic acid export membrane protein
MTPAPPSNIPLDAAMSARHDEEPARWSRLATFVDQGMVSLANFACTVLVARAAGEDELGLYALGFLVFVFLVGLSKALIWTPYTALFPRLDVNRQREFTASVTCYLAALLVVGGCTVIAVGVVCSLYFPQRQEFAQLLISLGPATTLLLLREHVRCLALARLEVRRLLTLDAAVTATQALLLGVLWAMGRLTAVSAYMAMAVACGWSLAWIWRRRDQFSLSIGALRRDWSAVWDISRWITPNAVMFQLGNQVPRWLLEAMYGLRQMGLFMSGQVMIQMANPLVLGNSNYFGPRAATIFAKQGAPGLWPYTIRNTVFLLSLITGIALAAGLVGPFFIAVAYGSNFHVDRALLVPLAFGMLSETLLQPIDVAMLTLGRASVSTGAATLRFAINVFVTSSLVYAWGATGIGYGLLAANLAALLWLWLAFWRETGRLPRASYDLALHSDPT